MTLLAGLLRLRGWIYWAIFTYVFSANAFFLVAPPSPFFPFLFVTHFNSRERKRARVGSCGVCDTSSCRTRTSSRRPTRSRMPSAGPESSSSSPSPCPSFSSCSYSPESRRTISHCDKKKFGYEREIFFFSLQSHPPLWQVLLAPSPCL